MIKSFLRLSLGVLMILAASAVLLMTDRARPRSDNSSSTMSPAVQRGPRSVALFQHISQPAIEEGARGVIAGLAASGYRDGDTMRLRRFNAEGDSATANTIAKELVGADYDLIITLSTPSLQAIAGANRDAKVPHVFGMVSDPVASGVGISRDDPKKHPPYMVGLGTMQPVADAFRMARKLSPKLARVGVAWNPSEANSEACTKVARNTCKEMGIELIEANVDNSAGIREAVSAVVGRGVDAVWIGGDVTVLSSLDSVLGPARAAGVPVFSNIPGCAARGILFDLGADYYQVGGKVGQLASMVLEGQSPASMPILYDVPPEFWINRDALALVKGGWSFPPAIAAKADVVVENKKTVRRRPHVEPTAVTSTSKPSSPSRKWKLGLASYSDSTVVEEGLAGLRAGLKESGLIEGTDITINYQNAQGDIATLNSIFDEFNGNDADLIVSFTTPALQAGLRKIDKKPLVFALVLDPFAAKAGKSATNHRPNVTGVFLDFPYSEVARTIREIVPDATKVGTVYTLGEVNSVVAKQRFEKALKMEGLELVSAPVNSATEVNDAALSLCQAGINVFCQVSDSLSNSSFPAISRACETNNMPLFSFASGQVKSGAILAVGSDYSENGRLAGLLVADVLRGRKDPSKTPFIGASKIRRTVNLDTARRYGLTIPDSWIRKADVVLPSRQTEKIPAAKQ